MKTTQQLSFLLAFSFFFQLISINGKSQSRIETTYPSKTETAVVALSDAKVWVDTFLISTDYKDLTAEDFRAISNYSLEDTRYAYWLFFPLKNKTSTTKKYWLQVGVFDSLTLIEKEGDHFTILNRGLLVSYDKAQKRQFNSLQQDKYGFEITLSPQSNKEFYLRIKNTVRFESTLSNIKLQSSAGRVDSVGKQTVYFFIFSAAFFGAIVFSILISLFQYLQNKNTSYLYYAIYLSLNVLYFWWKFEKANSVCNDLFAVFPQYYYYFESPLAIFIYISYFYFILKFLNAKTELPTFYKILKIAIPILFLYALLKTIVALQWGLSISWEIGYWMRFVLIPFSFYAIYQVFRSGHQLGFYILTGTSIMLLGGVITSILSKTYAQHYIGSWDIPLLPIQIGMLLEIIFFSAGLAYKSRLAVKEKMMLSIDLKQRQKESDFHRQRKEELTHLYTNLSHEFRTPLTVILGSNKQIKGHQKEKELIRRNGNQLLGLVNQVLDLNKLEVNKMDVNWQQGDVMNFVRYCIESFEILAEKKNISVEIFCFPNHLMMDFDVEKMQKIINNLLSNAIKYTPKDGRVRVDAYEDKKKNYHTFHLDVSDSGNGIPTHYHQSIFDHYVQLPNTAGGTGLGLALVKEMTQIVGGTISLNSSPGKGSIFQLSFPVHQAAALMADWNDFPKDDIEENINLVDAQSTEITAGKTTLLLVEDNQDVQFYLKRILKANYNIFLAKNGKAGLEMLKDIRPDLIISDVMMPEMNGYEFCEKVKSNSFSQHIPVILVTARASHEDRLKGLKQQADAYLTKPFDEEELLLRIQQLLQKNKVLAARSDNGLIKNDWLENTESRTVLFMDKFHKVLSESLQDEKFKIKDLCAEMGMSHVPINNNIKKITGQTTAQYIRNYRLNLAKEILQTTDLSVAEVSYKVGIPEPSNFNNMFKKAFGKSPKQWRNE